jgi:hypothetical protein
MEEEQQKYYPGCWLWYLQYYETVCAFIWILTARCLTASLKLPSKSEQTLPFRDWFAHFPTQQTQNDSISNHGPQFWRKLQPTAAFNRWFHRELLAARKLITWLSGFKIVITRGSDNLLGYASIVPPWIEFRLLQLLSVLCWSWLLAGAMQAKRTVLTTLWSDES